MEKKTVAEEIRELGNRLAQINPEGDQQATEERYGDDDFGIGDVGRELDVDDEGGGKGFEKENILMQLAKVLDNSNQTTVTTDDGKTFNVTPDQARTLRKFGTTNNVKTPIRLAFTKDIQHSHGLSDFLDQPNDQAMHVLYVTKYLG